MWCVQVQKVEQLQLVPLEGHPLEDRPCPCLAEALPYQAAAAAGPYPSLAVAEAVPFLVLLVLGTLAEHPCLVVPFLLVAYLHLVGPFLAEPPQPLGQEEAVVLVAE